MAANASISVVNALTDDYHPCQLLADLMTIREKKGRLTGLKIVWIGDGNNMSHSWLNAAALLGLDLTLAVPETYKPKEEIYNSAREKTSGKITLSHDPMAAAEGADVINTDVWASMGQESEAETRAKDFMAFQVNEALTARTAQDSIVLHCLPAHLGQEITEGRSGGSEVRGFRSGGKPTSRSKGLARISAWQEKIEVPGALQPAGPGKHDKKRPDFPVIYILG